MPRIVREHDNRLRGRDIRLVDAQNKQLGIVPFADAFTQAAEAKLDLVEVAGKAEPPVCRIMNFGKFAYEKNKQDRIQRKKHAAQKQKEVKFRANIDTNDYKIKLNRINTFLNKGFRVKVSLFFRGREMAHRELGHELMKRVAKDLAEIGVVDIQPRMTGRVLNMQLAPHSSK